MQLETGKTSHGLVGTFKNIVKEEGYVARSDFLSMFLTPSHSAGRLYRGTNVAGENLIQTEFWKKRACTTFDARGT